METKRSKQKIVYNPIVKIILGLIVCIGIVVIGQEIAARLLGMTALEKDYRNLIKGIIVSVLAIGGYKTFFKFYEKRTITELSTSGLAKNIAFGTLIGVVLQSLTYWLCISPEVIRLFR